MKRSMGTVLLGFLILSCIQGISFGREKKFLKAKEEPKGEKNAPKAIALIPPIDASIPDKLEKATFALG